MSDKYYTRVLANFELRGHGGKDNHVFLPSRTGAYFTNTCMSCEFVLCHGMLYYV